MSQQRRDLSYGEDENEVPQQLDRRRAPDRLGLPVRGQVGGNLVCGHVRLHVTHPRPGRDTGRVDRQRVSAPSLERRSGSRG